MSTTYEQAQNNELLEPPHNGTAGPPSSKDYGNGYHLDDREDPDTALRKIQTSGSISISPELFEKIYLSPQNRVSGDLRKTFANPTPLALGGFLLSLTPLSCDLMGWRGAGGDGAASIGAYFFFGGLLMILGAVGEFLLGNTFPMVVFGTFGSFWLTYAATLQPFYNAYGFYVGSNSGDPAGLNDAKFQASFAFFLLFMGLLCFVYMILALRTNIIFFLIFMLLVPSFGSLAGAFWHLAADPTANATLANNLLITAGALTFVIDLLGWYLFFSILLASLDFPFALPVGDLSRLIKGASEIQREKRHKAHDA